MIRVNVFVSHRWTNDASSQESLKSWLKDDDYYDFHMMDIPKEESLNDGIREGIRNRMNLSNIFIAFNNQHYSYDSGNNWMNFELNEAIRKGVPIIVVKKYGSNEIPSKLKDYPNCNWNSSSIRNLIKENKK